MNFYANSSNGERSGYIGFPFTDAQKRMQIVAVDEILLDAKGETKLTLGANEASFKNPISTLGLNLTGSSGAWPYLMFSNPQAPADARRWAIETGGQVLAFSAFADTWQATKTALQLYRNGNAIVGGSFEADGAGTFRSGASPDTLNLVSTSNASTISFYPGPGRNGGNKAGFIGFPDSGWPSLNIQNSVGDVYIQPKTGGVISNYAPATYFVNPAVGGATEVELGRDDGLSRLDLHGGATNTDYGFRIDRPVGANADTNLMQGGNGVLRLMSNGAVALQSGGVDAFVVNNTGNNESRGNLIFTDNGDGITFYDGSRLTSANGLTGNYVLKTGDTMTGLLTAAPVGVKLQPTPSGGYNNQPTCNSSLDGYVKYFAGVAGATTGGICVCMDNGGGFAWWTIAGRKGTDANGAGTANYCPAVGVIIN
jgi:hypothetical protein